MRAPRRLIAIAVLAVALVVAAALALGAGERDQDRAAAFVPRDALLYIQVAGDREDDQAFRAARLAGKVPAIVELRTAFLERLTATGGSFDWNRDVRPWLGDEAVVAVVGPAPTAARSLLVLRAEDEDAARRFGQRLAGATQGREHRGVEVFGKGDVAAALDGGFLLVGPPDAVRGALDVHRGAAPSLAADATFRRLGEQLPADRLVHGYASRAGLQALLAGPGAVLSGFPGADRLRGGAFAAAIEEGRARLSLRLLGPVPDAPGRRCARRRGGEAPAVDRASADVLAFVAVRGAGCLLQSLVARPGSTLGGALRRFADLARRDGVDLVRELPPLLDDQATVTLTGGGEPPAVAAVIENVDERAALSLLGRLQPTIASLLDPETTGRAPGFSARRVGDLTAFGANFGPNLELTYAARNGRLLVSTSPAGLFGAVRARGLQDSDDFRRLLGDRPAGPSDVVFLDLDGLVALADRLGVGEDPGYVALRDDLAKIGAAGAIIAPDGDQTTVEILLKTP